MVSLLDGWSGLDGGTDPEHPGTLISTLPEPIPGTGLSLLLLLLLLAPRLLLQRVNSKQAVDGMKMLLYIRIQ